MKHPGLQNLSRVREAAETAAAARRAAYHDVARLTAMLDAAWTCERQAEDELNAALVWLDKLARATEINDDGVPFAQSPGPRADTPS